jgi:hypothetical protein
MNRMSATYPHPGDPQAWIAPRYWEAFQAGTLRGEFLRPDPFAHWVLTDFFRPEVFERLRRDCGCEQTATFGMGTTSLNQGFLRVPDVLRLLYGPALRPFLNALTGSTLVRPEGDDVAASALAQVRHYVRGSSGLQIHTDHDVGFDLGMFVCLTADWRPGLGGETCLYRRVGGLFLETEVIPPKGNTLILLGFSADSYHCVREMAADWRKSILFLGWQTGSPAPAPLASAEETALGHRDRSPATT